MQTDEAEEGQSDLDNDEVSGRKSFAVNRESLWVGGRGDSHQRGHQRPNTKRNCMGHSKNFQLYFQDNGTQERNRAVESWA